MQYFTLALAATAAIASTASFAILILFAKEGKAIQTEVETLKSKTTRNAAKVAEFVKTLEI